MDEKPNLFQVMNNLVARISVNELKDFDKDMVWCVTRLRTGAYVMFSSLGLLTPDQPITSFDYVEGTLRAIACNYLIIAAQHPARIEYSPDKVETPRLDILGATASVFDQLTSDTNIRQSAEELVRLVATNPDSNHDRIGYATLFGIILKMMAWLYPGIDIVDWMSKILDGPEQPEENKAA